MTFWTGRNVARVLGVGDGSDWPAFTSIQTDTRLLEGGELFVALEGERFDGHQFLHEALEAGARAAVVRKGTPHVGGLVTVEVDDTLVAYGHLARFRRRTVSGPVVAITGTNGKTSTKELVHAVLGTRWATHATRLNNNNRVGVPLTILESPENTEALVLEAGANEIGELAHLRRIIEPDIGVVTNVSSGHLSGFGSLEGVLEEKISLLNGVPVSVVGTQPELAERAKAVSLRVLTAGVEPTADVHPDRWELDSHGCGRITFGEHSVSLAVPGLHQVANAAVAMGVARVAGLDDAVATALGSVGLPHGRCEVITTGSLTLLNDTYNANPASLRAALQLAESLRNRRPLVIVVGTMLELGAYSQQLHREAADEIMALEPELIAAVGDFVPQFESIQSLVDGDRLITAADVDELGRVLRGRLKGNELVLLKASRGVGLERAIPHLTGN